MQEAQYAGMVAGSHARNQLILIPQDSPPAPLYHPDAHVCQICGDSVGTAPQNGDVFVACNECAFPVCRPCYEYERQDGNHVCPQCKTRYKRHKGSPRVPGDEEEDDVDDLENEFNYHRQQPRAKVEVMSKRSISHTGRVMIDHSAGFTSEQQNPPGAFSTDSGAGSSKKSREFRKGEFPYTFGHVAWQDRLQSWNEKEDGLTDTGISEKEGRENREAGTDKNMIDEANQPFSRKVPLPSSRINPYRIVIIMRLFILAFFLKFRLQNPVNKAFGLWLTSIICEIWFSISWILDQFPKWLPVNRETYPDRLSLRFEPEGLPSRLAPVDVFVSTVDPSKEPPLVTANTVLSILAVDYPVKKVSCYVSDDGAAMLTFEVLSETSEFARIWVPFCKKFNIEPRAPEVYFAQKIDYLKDKVQPTFVKERRAMKREYEEFQVKVNALVAKTRKVPEDGWIMQDGSAWPGNNTRDHPGMIQVFLGHTGSHDIEGNELPRLVYMSREKRPGFNHHKKAGAMNSLVRVSAILTNAPYLLNLDCDHYINNSKAIREAMCFMMDPIVGKDVCFVQFPQRFDGVDLHDRYANHNTVFFDINLKGLDGIQGPVYVGTGCVFRRQALYGLDAPVSNEPVKDNYFLRCCCGPRKRRNSKVKKSNKADYPPHVDTSTPIFEMEHLEEDLESDDTALLMTQKSNERRFGQSPVFITSTLYENGGIPESIPGGSLLKEAIHVISCGYEDKTLWGKEIGWIYGSVTEDILTGFKMHCRGWRSIYCMPIRPAFKGSAPINLSDRLHQVLRWALGSVEILLSRHCPMWYAYGGRLKWLQRLAYINTIVYPITSIPLIAYCTLPAICLLTGKFIIPEISNFASLWFLSLFLSIFVTGILEMRWSGVGIDDWWRNEQFWVIGGVSAHLFAVFQGLLKLLAGIETNFTVTTKGAADETDAFGDLYLFKWTTLLIPPTTLIVINIVGIVAGISEALNSGYQSWGPLLGKLFFAMWVILHLYPFLKGLTGRQNRTPTIVIVWSILLASIFSLLWVKIDPFVSRRQSPSFQLCGNLC